MLADPDIRTAVPPRPAAAPEPRRPDVALEAPQWLGDDGDEDRSRWTGLIVSVLLHVLVIGVIVAGWYYYQSPSPPVAQLHDNGGDIARAEAQPVIDNGTPAGAPGSDHILATPAAAAPAPSVPAPPIAQAPPAPAPVQVPPPLPAVRHVARAAAQRSEYRDALLPKSRDPLLAWPPRAPVLAPPTEAASSATSDGSPPESRDPLLGSEPADAPLPESHDPLLAHAR